jgi:4-hydroxy-2-oxoheptanedioate aldolase
LGLTEESERKNMVADLQALARNGVKEKLVRDEVVVSMIVRLVRSIEIARIAATCGFDSFYVDMEHNTFSFDSTSQICIAALEAGVVPFVRVPSYGPEFISRILDGGAMGIIAPHVSSAADARQVVEFAKYPPLGKRSAAGALPHLHYRSFPLAEANQAMNRATSVIAMIESSDALERVEEIAAVEGVDLLHVGTTDLSSDLGIAGQFDHPLIEDAYKRIIAACRTHHKHVGVGGLSSRPDLMAKFVGLGARYLSTGTDLNFLLKAAGETAKLAREMRAAAAKG